MEGNMHCKICGTQNNVSFRASHTWKMCDHCHENSDKHVLSYGEFNDEYWDDDDDVPFCTRNEFYSDYRSSGLSYEDYVSQTSEVMS
tara:strand:+ start:16556 stop:16816 length:261 start_codon:yes stop_codon:yes gene_type:complete